MFFPNFLNMKQNKTLFIVSITLFFTLLFVVSAVIFKIFDVDGLPSQFYGALMGAVITCIITLLLLQGQSGTEELKERNMAVFNQKQDVYHRFLEELHRIVQDGEITIGSRDSNGNIDTSIDELKDLIFQLGFLQLHTSEETIRSVLDELVKMIQTLNEYGSSDETSKQQKAPEFYSQLSNSLFSIVAVLRKDLYEKESHPIDKDQMESILKECDLYVERTDFNRIEAQLFFWNELRRQLKEKGYLIVDPDYDFTDDVNKYYARARGRHRWFGFKFKNNDCPATFEVQVENSYYYGVVRGSEWEENEKISAAISKISGFQASAWWYGWRQSQNYNLNFWNLDSPGFQDLKNSKTASAFIRHIADELDFFAQRFVKEYNQN